MAHPRGRDAVTGRRRRIEETAWPVLLGVLAVALVVLFWAVAANAQTGGGYSTGGSIGGQIVVPGTETSGSGTSTGGTSGGSSGGGSGPAPTCTGPIDPTDPDSPSQTGTITYTAASPGLTEVLDGSGLQGNENLGVISGKPTPDAVGTWYTRWCGTNPRGFGGYVWAPQGTSPAAIATPPAPPSPAEIRDRTPLPAPTIEVSPLTGLAGARAEARTALWDANGAEVRTVNLTLRGYTVVVRAGAGTWEWSLGAGNPTITTYRPGTAADPAVRHTYGAAGDYTVGVTVTWSGSYTYSGNGTAAQTVALPTSTRTATIAYSVDAVQPVLEALRS